MKYKIGGQAVINGVMIRSAHFYVVAVRKKDSSIAFMKERVPSLKKRFPILKVPFLRGFLVLLESLVVGFKALSYSANILAQEEIENFNEKLTGRKIKRKGAINTNTFIFSFIISLVIGTLLFILLPLTLTEQLKKILNFSSIFVFNLIDGIIRIIIFLLYLIGIRFFPDIKKVFSYHGAEHKVIANYEADEGLSVENASKFSTANPRCGTSFILTVMVIAILIFSVIPAGSVLSKIVIRLVVFPLIAGISYEVIKLFDKYKHTWIVKYLISPNLWLQGFTTNIPSDDQIEVGLFALNKVIDAEKENEMERKASENTEEIL